MKSNSTKRSAVGPDKDRRRKLQEKYELEIENLKKDQLQLIVFSIDKQDYAFEILKTKEVIETPPISPLPYSPDYVEGIGTVRKSTMLMINLYSKFRIPNPYESKTGDFTLVIAHNKYEIGLVLHEVPMSLKVPGDSIGSASDILLDSTREDTYIKAIVKYQDRIIYIMDIEEFVESNRLDLHAKTSKKSK